MIKKLLVKIHRIKKKFHHLYYQVLPYELRPYQIWYRTKCFCWHRYTTVKSRYLGHTYCDYVDLLPETMFEILSQFMEKEIYPNESGRKTEHIFIVNGQETNVGVELERLYKWWHNYWHKERNEKNERLWEEVEKLQVQGNLRTLNWLNSDDPKFQPYRDALDKINEEEEKDEQLLNEMMHRLVDLRRYLWT
jgi:hypothetical protein